MPALKVENAQVFLRKISLNILQQNAANTRFTLPMEGLSLAEKQLDAYMGAYTFASWFNKRKDGIWVPMDWWTKLPKGEMLIDEEFETDGAEIVVSGNKPLVFKATEADEDDEDSEPQPAARVTNIRLSAKLGGVVLVSFHLQVAPGLGQENLALQKHQFRHVTLTLGDLKAIERKEKQQALPLEPAAEGAGAAPANGSSHPAAGASGEDKADDAKAFEAGARRKVEEHKSKRGSGAIDGRTRGGRSGARHR